VRHAHRLEKHVTMKVMKQKAM